MVVALSSECKKGDEVNSSPFACNAAGRYAAARLNLLLFRAALFRWMSPLRAARSSNFAAVSLTSAVAPGAFAFFRAVRRAERCARLRAVAARDLRMFFWRMRYWRKNSPKI